MVISKSTTSILIFIIGDMAGLSEKSLLFALCRASQTKCFLGVRCKNLELTTCAYRNSK